MKNESTPLGSRDLWLSAVKHAEELSLSTGEDTFVYHRPQDDKWFVLSAGAPAPEGQTIKTAVRPRATTRERSD